VITPICLKLDIHHRCYIHARGCECNNGGLRSICYQIDVYVENFKGESWGGARPMKALAIPRGVAETVLQSAERDVSLSGGRTSAHTTTAPSQLGGIYNDLDISLFALLL
jgi:hypothetical protein